MLNRWYWFRLRLSNTIGPLSIALASAPSRLRREVRLFTSFAKLMLRGRPDQAVRSIGSNLWLSAEFDRISEKYMGPHREAELAAVEAALESCNDSDEMRTFMQTWKASDRSYLNDAADAMHSPEAQQEIERAVVSAVTYTQTGIAA
jgi:hypothetical protein